MNRSNSDEEYWMEPGCSAAELPRAVLMLLFGTPVLANQQSVAGNDSLSSEDVTATIIRPDARRDE